MSRAIAYFQMEGRELEVWKPLLTLWYAFNILAMVWFGFIHQAGVMPIQRDIGSIDHAGVPYINLVYSHTYMPPR